MTDKKPNDILSKMGDMSRIEQLRFAITTCLGWTVNSRDDSHGVVRYSALDDKTGCVAECYVDKIQVDLSTDLAAMGKQIAKDLSRKFEAARA